MRTSSPPRRRLALLLSLTAAFTVAWLAPVPQAQSQQVPGTVARTVWIPLSSFAPAVGPSPLQVSGESFRSGSPIRTQATSVCSPIWSTMVAFAWHQAGDASIGTSVQTDSGSDATVIDDTDAQPNIHTPEYHPNLRTSDLYWTGGTRCIRFSLRMPGGVAVSDLRADFLNTSGTAAGPGTGPPDTPAPGTPAPGPFGATRAQAMTSQPQMVTRAQWGAMQPRRNCLSYVPSIRMAYVHHTSGTNSYSPAQSDDVVRGIQYFHEVTRGYCDIAYNFLVDKYGTIFVGRATSDDVSVNVVPASQMGFNPYTFSVSAMGNFQTVAPSAAMIQSIEHVLAWRLDVAHLPPEGRATMTSEGGPTDKYRAGRTVTLPLVSGHRQTGLTDCPGNFLWAQLPAIRQAVAGLGTPKFYRPSVSRAVVTPLRDSTRFTASATEPLQWEIDILDESGNVVQNLYASGSQLSVSWDGTTRDGLPAPPGTYTAEVFGQTADGRGARAAEIPVAVNPVAPTPSPSPTPTITPSPSPTPSA